MRKLLSTWFAISLTLFPFISVAYGQEPVDREMIAKIREEGLKRSKAYETFTHFTEVIGPRLTGTPAHKTAEVCARRVNMPRAKVPNKGPMKPLISLFAIS